MFIVTDPPQRGLRLPSGSRDVPLMVSERSFRTNNQLTDPFAHGPTMVGPPRLDGVDGPPRPAGRRHDRRHRARQRPRGAVPPRLGDPLPAATAQLLALLQLQLRPLRRAAVPPDRHGQRPAPPARWCAPTCCSGPRSAPTCWWTSTARPASDLVLSSDPAADRHERRRRPPDADHGVPRRRPGARHLTAPVAAAVTGAGLARPVEGRQDMDFRPVGQRPPRQLLVDQRRGLRPRPGRPPRPPRHRRALAVPQHQRRDPLRPHPRRAVAHAAPRRQGARRRGNGASRTPGASSPARWSRSPPASPTTPAPS